MRVVWFFSDRAGVGTYRSHFPGFYLVDTKSAAVEMVEQREVVKTYLKQLAATEHQRTNPHGPAPYVGPVLNPEDYEAADVMVLQRSIGGPFPAIMKECQRRGIPTLVDLDDDLWAIPRTNNARHWWGRAEIQRDLSLQLNLATRVMVSTVPLARAIARQMGWSNWRERISVCPNHLRQDYWGERTLCPVTPVDNGGKVIIGWQGSTTHETDFSAAAKALAAVAAKYPQVKIRLFGSLPDVVKTTVPPDRRDVVKGVGFDKYPATLKFIGFDIGIAPLTPCRFNDSKSNLKWLEYSALRIPCVASKVFPYATSIRHGETGFLAETPAEWERALSALVEDVALRRAIGDAAYRDVWTRFSPDVAGPAWVAALQAAYARRKAVA